MIRRKGLVGYVKVIHPSAWKVDSPKSAGGIRHNLLPRGKLTGLGASPGAGLGHNTCGQKSRKEIRPAGWRTLGTGATTLAKGPRVARESAACSVSAAPPGPTVALDATLGVAPTRARAHEKAVATGDRFRSLSPALE